jgi:hypothetical protein
VADLAFLVMQTRLAPLAFQHAETTRATGLTVMRSLALLTVAMAAVFAVALQVAIGLSGNDGVRYVAGLVAAAAVGGYAAAGPAIFARVSRAATAPVACRWLAWLVLLHVAGWMLVLAAIHG